MSTTDEYSLYEPIGKGSYGKVYRGVHTPTGLVVAIKVFDMDSDGDEITTIRKEIAILSHCDSPLITRYHKSILVGTKLWLIMDYAGGGSIRRMLKSGVIPEQAIAIITQQVTLALVYLHKTAQIIHRDVKAANIVLTENGLVKLCDFGVSGHISMNSRRNSFVGTANWMAPEIILRSHYGFKADVWSLGITVIEMATGNPPFADQDPRRTLYLIPRSRPPKLSGQFSTAMKDFINTCLKEEPDDRPSTEELIKHKFVRNAPQIQDGMKVLQKLLKRQEIWESTVEHDTISEGSASSMEDLDGTMEQWDFDTIRQKKDYSRRMKNLSFGSPRDSTSSQNNKNSNNETTPPGSNTIKQLTVSISPKDLMDELSFCNFGTKATEDPKKQGMQTETTATTNTGPKMRLLHSRRPKHTTTPAVEGWTGDNGWQGLTQMSSKTSTSNNLIAKSPSVSPLSTIKPSSVTSSISKDDNGSVFPTPIIPSPFTSPTSTPKQTSHVGSPLAGGQRDFLLSPLRTSISNYSLPMSPITTQSSFSFGKSGVYGGAGNGICGGINGIELVKNVEDCIGLLDQLEAALNSLEL